MADFPQPEGVTAPLNHDNDTYFLHDWLVDAIIRDLSPRSQKLWLTDAYCRHWIAGHQVEAFLHAYCLEAV